MFKFNKNEPHKLVSEKNENFISILSKIVFYLDISKNFGQSKNVQKAINFLNNNEIENFARYINGVDFWGGSGAVWEVYIEDSKINKDFCLEIIKLINLLEETKNLGRGIKPIKELLLKSI